jgi:hypothetical protein
MDPVIKAQVHARVVEAKTCLDSRGENVVSCLQSLQCLLPSGSAEKADFENLSVAQNVFRQNEYCSWLRHLLRFLTTAWSEPSALDNSLKAEIYAFFVHGWATEVTIILCQELASSRFESKWFSQVHQFCFCFCSGYKQQKVISILEDIYSRNTVICEILLDQGTLPVAYEDEIFTLLITLPDRIASKLQDDSRCAGLTIAIAIVIQCIFFAV